MQFKIQDDVAGDTMILRPRSQDATIPPIKSKQEDNNNNATKYNQHHMRLPPLRLATAFISSRTSSVPPTSRSLFSTSALNMKSNAATQAEGAVIVGGGIAGLAVAAALRNVAGGEGYILCTRCASCLRSVAVAQRMCAVPCNLLTPYDLYRYRSLLLYSIQCQSIGSMHQS